ncbi:LysR family transcriptional regulator [Oxalicibacterium faecigallinarum]|uniref:Transcriptional regulator n=1 Tax=Oxalicibacterium faecigallinarum TaxID=573741 RepID=A0A8J3F261_9BURK|nr:LysR family transcriptional regulator [Oxalicibacterium faecigallinarum]GGI20622.1 transcriptional regulator [Oxalicibacterium faecigallinarum]
MDRLDELEVFLAILDTGSLVGASRKLGRSAPAVTRLLSALEERIGTRLLERTTRHLAATEAGLRLAGQARQVLSLYEAAVSDDASTAMRGKLRITAPMVFGRRHVAPIVNSYLDRYPEMQVEMMMSDRNLDLIEEGLDLAVRIGTLADTTLVARPVGMVGRLLVASPDYLARRGMPQTPHDLLQHDVIFTTERIHATEWRFRHEGRERTVQLTPRLTVNEIDAALLAAKAGRGIARALSYQVAEDLEAGALVRLLPDYEPAPLPVQLVVTGTRHMVPRLRAFLDHAVSALSNLSVIQQAQFRS